MKDWRGALVVVLCLWKSAWGVESGDYPYLACFSAASDLHDVPLDVLLAVAATESSWDPDARSDANAHGIMQIQWPGTAKHLGVTRVSELYNPCLNIELGARYLRELLDRNHGDIERALASYNYGPTRIASSQRLPDGARRYVATVNRHRSRIAKPSTSQADNAFWGSAEVTVRFGSGIRARRFARALSERVRNARFVSSRSADGSYVVSMEVESSGLSVADIRVLEAFGWPAMGGG